MSQLQCHACGAAISIGPPIPRDAECQGCGRDLRCCMNCRHYDPAYHHACRETQADPVEDKQRRNFCEYFSSNPEAFKGASAAPAKSSAARARLEAVFGSAGEAAGPPKDARARLESLFRKPPPEGDEAGGG